MMISSRLLYLMMIVVFCASGLAFSGCASHAKQQIRKTEKAVKKEKKQKVKDFENLKKRHYQMQSDETKKRMKASEKRSKKYYQQRKGDSFWQKIFGN